MKHIYEEVLESDCEVFIAKLERYIATKRFSSLAQHIRYRSADRVIHPNFFSITFEAIAGYLIGKYHSSSFKDE